MVANLRAGHIVAGRLDHHPAARQEPLPDAGAHLRAQDPGGDPGAVAGAQLSQEADPRRSTSTGSISAPAPTASMPPRTAISANRRATSPSPRPQSLAGLLKAPSRYSPTNHPQAAEARAQIVLAAMADAGFITARRGEPRHVGPDQGRSRDVAGGSGRYVADWVMDVLPHYIGVHDQDIVVDTTIDLHLQAAAAKAIADTLAQEGAKYRVGQGALVAIDPTARSRHWSAGATTPPASSTAPSTRTASRARRSNPSSISTALEAGWCRKRCAIDQPVTIKRLEAGELRQELSRPGDAGDGAGAVAQHGGGRAHRRGRPESGGGDRPPPGHHLAAACRRRRSRSAPPR